MIQGMSTWHIDATTCNTRTITLGMTNCNPVTESRIYVLELREFHIGSWCLLSDLDTGRVTWTYETWELKSHIDIHNQSTTTIATTLHKHIISNDQVIFYMFNAVWEFLGGVKWIFPLLVRILVYDLNSMSMESSSLVAPVRGPAGVDQSRPDPTDRQCWWSTGAAAGREPWKFYLSGISGLRIRIHCLYKHNICFR